eukprot:1137654-Pelagomonas_calceolata.AAC.6
MQRPLACRWPSRQLHFSAAAVTVAIGRRPLACNDCGALRYAPHCYLLTAAAFTVHKGRCPIGRVSADEAVRGSTATHLHPSCCHHGSAHRCLLITAPACA